MPLPYALYHAIEQLLNTQNLPQIREARRALTQRYHDLAHDSHDAGYTGTKAGRLSYLATRMPATYEVCCKVLGYLSSQPSKASKVTSLLDLGAGPGTAAWATHSLFPNLRQATLVEKERGYVDLGIKLFKGILEQKKRPDIKWFHSSLKDALPFRPHALVTLSYVLGELSIREQERIVKAAWDATQEFFVLIEPGTPRGFDRIRQARDQLIQQGAFILAPCPHNAACPMPGKDWCHFSQRLERTPLHRLVKEASLAYEDEKYSYIIVSKSPSLNCPSRIIRKPRHGTGHLILDLCRQDGLKRLIVSKRDEDLYRMSRHLGWGDSEPNLDDVEKVLNRLDDECDE